MYLLVSTITKTRGVDHLYTCNVAVYSWRAPPMPPTAMLALATCTSPSAIIPRPLAAVDHAWGPGAPRGSGRDCVTCDHSRLSPHSMQTRGRVCAGVVVIDRPRQCLDLKKENRPILMMVGNIGVGKV